MLDTWFSSALWPYATLGWPEQTPELERYYPGDVNSTAREIIRLWENRMIWTGLELMGEIPFTDVIIHSTILAADGRRMSKSLGTGIDPLDLIAKHGADATRYGLLKMSSTQDVRFAETPLEEGRKLGEQALERLAAAAAGARRAGGGAELAGGAVDPGPPRRGARGARGRVEAVRVLALDADDLPPHVRRLLRLVRRGDQAAARRDRRCAATALAALEKLLQLLHPVMPHVTEEIWSQFHDDRLIVAPWPEPTDAYAADLHALDAVQEAAAIFRRSGVAVPLEGDEQRIFAAVVRPERSKVNGNATAEIERLRKEIERGERVLANDKFVANAKPEVVEAEREKLARYRRELDALSG